MNRPKINKVLNLLIRLFILVASYWFIYYQIIRKDTLSQTWSLIRDGIPLNTLVLTLGIVFLLMILNWSVEAIKWRYLIRKTEKISFWTAFRAVMAGLTVSTFTPNRIGEYFGRVFILKETNPWQGAFMTVVGSFSQFMVTVIVGSIAIVFFAFYYIPYQLYISEYLFWFLIFLIFIINVFLLILYFNVKLFEPLLRRLTLKRWVNLRNHLKVFGVYKGKELFFVLLLSFTRYIVFTLQFFILMKLFLVPIGFCDGLMLIACIYLFMAAVPTIALSELGVRGSLAMFFLNIYFANNYLIGDTADLGAVSAASVIWLINLVIPAIIGGIFVVQLKFFRK
jgi:uncharacterized membrane protein YbhN (UPF0104 family)